MEKLAETFWNIRGVHRVGGVIDIGTQMSLVRREDGDFIVIDGCGLDDSQRASVMALTDNGERQPCGNLIREALRDEAERICRQLQSGTGADKSA